MAESTATNSSEELEEYRGYVQRAVSNVSDVLCAVADGKYDTFASSERDDEFGTLAMVTNVVVNAVRRAVHDLETAMAEVKAENEAKQKLVEELQEKMTLIERQQLAIQELSTPVLQIWDSVLALPVIGVVDTHRAAEIMEQLLREIQRWQTKWVILDITGVDIVDTKTADHFVKVVRAAQLLGARCFLTGIRPVVAQTLIDLGIDLTGIRTLHTLKEGLQACIREMAPPERRTGAAGPIP